MEAESRLGASALYYTNLIWIKLRAFPLLVKLLEAGKWEYNLEDLVEW